MAKLLLKTNPKVDEIFASYPAHVRSKMQYLRTLVIETAEEEDIDELEETLKWGEPSFVTKKGSTLRMDWKPKSPDQYAMYFQCTSRLVPTFKMVFGKKFQYEGDRAIVFQLNQKIDDWDLKKCIKACLTYHKVKHLATLEFEITPQPTHAQRILQLPINFPTHDNTLQNILRDHFLARGN